MGNRLPEWLVGRWTRAVAVRLAVSTRVARMEPKRATEIGRMAGAAYLAAHTPEQVHANCLRARQGRWLRQYRAAGYVIDVAPMPYMQFCVLEAIRDRPGIHPRGIARSLGLYARSVHHAAEYLIGAGLLKHVQPSMPGHGVRHGLGLTEAGAAELARVEGLLHG